MFCLEQSLKSIGVHEMTERQNQFKVKVTVKVMVKVRVELLLLDDISHYMRDLSHLTVLMPYFIHDYYRPTSALYAIYVFNADLQITPMAKNSRTNLL